MKVLAEVCNFVAGTPLVVHGVLQRNGGGRKMRLRAVRIVAAVELAVPDCDDN
jgi:hypothetical protein